MGHPSFYLLYLCDRRERRKLLAFSRHLNIAEGTAGETSTTKLSLSPPDLIIAATIGVVGTLILQHLHKDIMCC